MKSKIEIGKLGTLGKVLGNDEFAWVLRELNMIIEKQNEIIDYLNSQSQPEEEVLDRDCGQKLVKRTLGDGTEEVQWVSDEEVKDTPEEWERLRRDGALAFYIELEDWLYEKGYAKHREIKVPTEVFMRFVAKELKLNSKKK